jgi:hypothetical protein
MLVPKSWKAATQARATSAAATAYSDSSNPVSSLRNLLNIWRSSFGNAALLNDVCQGSDFGCYVGAQELEGGDTSERNKRGGYRVFRKFQPGFIIPKFPKHSGSPPSSILLPRYLVELRE